MAVQVYDDTMLGNIMNNKAIAYADLNHTDSALIFINAAIKYYKSVGNIKQLTEARCNKAGYLLNINQTDSANYYLSLAHKECDIEKYPRLHVGYLIANARYFQSVKQEAKAVSFLDTAREVSDRFNLVDRKLDALVLLSEQEAQFKNWQDAYEYSSKAYHIQDSIYDIKKVEEMAFLQKSFEILKHEKETELHKTKSKLLASELKNERQSSFIIVLIAVLLAVIAIVVFIVFLNYRQKKNMLAATNLQLKLSNQDLVDANNVKSKLISVLSHDLKSPLSSIISMSSLMEMSPTIKDDTDLQMVHAIGESSNMMLSFIDNTLLWFKKVHGNLKLDYQEISINNIMEETAYWFQSVSKLKNITLSFEGDDLTLVSDKNILLVLMRNLVSNAIKFSNNGQTIAIRWFESGDRLTITVQDNGMGMSSEQVKAINEQQGIGKFTSGTNGETSTGLGLFLCKELICTIGGYMRVSSTVGKGTEVCCVLNKKV